MSLQEALNAFKADFETKVPPAALAVIHQATENLRASGIVEDALKKGDPAPPFSLKDTDGTVKSLDDLLKDGPLILSFYRGKW
jgi:hypothetical protein